MAMSTDKGVHGTLQHPYIFIDSCVQIWPDADFSKLNQCGCTAYAVTAWMPHDGAEVALDEVANWYRIAQEYPEAVRIAYTAADIIQAKQRGQSCLIITSQGGNFLGNKIHRLELFHRMGLRIMIPAYNDRNAICDGCLEPANAGLSQFGRRWVDECNRLGILIDLTHTGERATLEILDRTAHPVIFSHSNPKALVDNPRNISDEQIKRCAATGGVVAPTNWGPLNFKLGMTSRPTLEHYLDAVEYIVNLVGIDHVGIGTDMSHGTYPDGDLIRGRSPAVGGSYGAVVEASPRSKLRYVEGFDDYSQLLNVVDGLGRRGYNQEEIMKVLGGNYLRVFRQVWGA